MEKQVVCAIIKKTNKNKVKEFLLVSSKKDFGKFTGCWHPSGGHLKENETQEQALIREVKEEVNLKIKPIKLLCKTKGDVPNQKTFWWNCKTKNHKIKLSKNDNVHTAGFFTEKEIKKMQLWPATKKVFEKFIFKKEN